MEKDSEGIKVLHPKAQSLEFITAELLLLILKYPNTPPFFLSGARGRAEISYLK